MTFKSFQKSIKCVENLKGLSGTTNEHFFVETTEFFGLPNLFDDAL